MTDSRLFNVYCDESCHLEHDGVPVMAWGAVYCPASETRSLADAMRALKVEHGLNANFEAKWQRCTLSQVAVSCSSRTRPSSHSISPLC
jgi:hypothetical protein